MPWMVRPPRGRLRRNLRRWRYDNSEPLVSLAIGAAVVAAALALALVLRLAG